MLSLVLFFLLISSGSVFAAVYWKRPYEDMVPPTIFCVVEIIFLFGMLDHLRMGAYVACALCVILYVLAIKKMLREHSERETLSLLLTPAFFIFLVVLVVYAFCIVGIVAYKTDSFYFWALCTKQLWYQDTFHCLPDVKTLFAEYPPGLSLFEFFLLTIKGSFSEWRMVFAYSTLIFSLHLPFLRGLSRKPRLGILPLMVLIAIVILLSGSVFYPDSIASLYADLPLGAVFAYGMARVFFLEKSNWSFLDIAGIIMTANMLVLIKSAGMLFALLLMAALFLTMLSGVSRKKWKAFKVTRKSILKGASFLVPFMRNNEEFAQQVIVIDSTGYGYAVVMDYILYPYYSVPWICTFGSVPKSTNICTPEEFQSFVRGNNYKYIAIRELDDDFINTYSCLFDSQLADGQIYRVIEESEVFTLVKPDEEQ